MTILSFLTIPAHRADRKSEQSAAGLIETQKLSILERNIKKGEKRKKSLHDGSLLKFLNS